MLLLLLLLSPAALLHLVLRAVSTHDELICLTHVVASIGHVLVGEGSQGIELADFRIYGGDVRRHQELVLKALKLALRVVSAHVRSRHAHHLPSHLATAIIGCHERLLRCGLLELEMRLICHIIVSHTVPVAVETLPTGTRVLIVLVEA